MNGKIRLGQLSLLRIIIDACNRRKPVAMFEGYSAPKQNCPDNLSKLLVVLSREMEAVHPVE